MSRKLWLPLAHVPCLLMMILFNVEVFWIEVIWFVCRILSFAGGFANGLLCTSGLSVQVKNHFSRIQVLRDVEETLGGIITNFCVFFLAKSTIREMFAAMKKEIILLPSAFFLTTECSRHIVSSPVFKKKERKLIEQNKINRLIIKNCISNKPIATQQRE